MEDPESEWKIQASSSKEDEGATMVKWMLKTGRKIAVTGIMISSAPLVLPPLVVFSAMGVAVSVPFGLLFAGYACNKKLMTILLPPLMLEYYDYRKLDAVEENEDGHGAQVEGYYADKENNEQIDDVTHGVETGMGLDDGYRLDGLDEIREREMQDDMVQRENVCEEKEGEDIKQGVKMRLAGDDPGYEEDAGEGDDDILEEELKGKEPLVESQIDENGSTVEEDYVDETEPEMDSTELVQVGNENDKAVGEMGHVILAGGIDFNSREVGELDLVAREDDILQRESVAEEKEREHMEDIDTGPNFDLAGDDSLEEGRKGEEPLVESGSNENKDEPEVNEDAKLKDKGRVEDDYVGSESGLNVAFGDVKDVETTKPVTVTEIDSEKIVEAGSKNDNPVAVGEIRHVSQGSDENNFNSREFEELDLVARQVMGDANKDERNVESDENVVKESMGTVEITVGNASKDGRVDAVMEEHLLQANADSLEIGDGERKNNVNFESLEVGSEAKENAGDENVDVLARSPSKQAPLDAGKAQDASKTYYKKTPSGKENLDEEKTWERIRAMRTIVGYKAPTQATCMGELKALYVFTGVEPPASSEGDSDLDEVDAKLKFLMAIVGVK